MKEDSKISLEEEDNSEDTNAGIDTESVYKEEIEEDQETKVERIQ